MALADPFEVFVDESDIVYAVDWRKHPVVCSPKGDTQGSVIIGEGKDGNGSNQFYHPMDIAFDRQGNLYISDCTNHRLQKFNRNKNNI
ncbi:unnamed protein product [Rotaria socialis]|nr:unnamed protein product [Rotaria socialis]CAF4571244.1 unnamed protein product [Rotaria socialis]